MNKQLWTIAGTAFVSLSVGAAGGYLFARKQLTDVYQLLLEEEVERTKAYYRQRNQNGGFETALDAAAALLIEEKEITAEDFAQIAKDLGYVPDENLETEDHNIFDGGAEDMDDDAIAQEEALRSDEEPYIISVEEYMQSENGYRQFTLTYFEGDDTLVDEHEKPVDETAKYVGDNNLKRFGHRSRDRNVLYIRNEKAELEFEVIRSQRSYTEDVLGFVKPQSKIPQRMRGADV